jgi:glycosyltransferase involved in cell wall biosynthesis
MIEGNRVAVVMPAYNAARTLEQTAREIPDSVDIKILVDDHSSDDTVSVATRCGLKVFVHKSNRGYGANQKTCYREALASGADIIVMLHPDYQYNPALVPAMAGMIASGVYDIVLGSRILGGALRGGMPLYKYVANRFLTAFENFAVGAKLSEYHTGFRGFRRSVIESLPLLENSDDFVFDNQMLVQSLAFGYRVGEISCPASYFEEASSINFWRSLRYGFGVLATALKYKLQRMGFAQFSFLNQEGRTLDAPTTTVIESSLPREGVVERVPLA